MRVSTRLCVIATASAAMFAALVVTLARNALSASPAPPPILLWDRINTWQSDTTLPGLNLGDVHFVQNGADVTGTFTGGSLTAVAAGLKLKGFITLPGDLGTQPFSIKLGADDYQTFEGKIHSLKALESYTFGGLYRQNVGTERGTVNLMLSIGAAALPKPHKSLPKLHASRRSDLPLDFVVYAVAQNLGPDLVPPGALQFEFTFEVATKLMIEDEYYFPNNDAVNGLYTLTGMTLPRYYQMSRILSDGTYFRQLDPVTGDVVDYRYTVGIGALGSKKDRAIVGVLVHLGTEFGALQPNLTDYITAWVDVKSVAPGVTVVYHEVRFPNGGANERPDLVLRIPEADLPAKQ